MTRSVSRPDMTDCIVSSWPGRSSVQPKAARAVSRSAAEASRRGTRGPYPESAGAIGENSVQLGGAPTPGPTRRHPLAKRLGVLQLLEERVTSAQALTIRPVHVHLLPKNT